MPSQSDRAHPYIGAMLHIPTMTSCRAVWVVRIDSDISMALASFGVDEHEFVSIANGVWHWREDCPGLVVADKTKSDDEIVKLVDQFGAASRGALVACANGVGCYAGPVAQAETRAALLAAVQSFTSLLSASEKAELQKALDDEEAKRFGAIVARQLSIVGRGFKGSRLSADISDRWYAANMPADNRLLALAEDAARTELEVIECRLQKVEVDKFLIEARSKIPFHPGARWLDGFGWEEPVLVDGGWKYPSNVGLCPMCQRASCHASDTAKWRARRAR